MAVEPEKVRIDKWLWAARFFKTRSIAQEAVELGRVRLAGQRMKSSREVHPGDLLQIERGDETFCVHVEKLSAVRGPASVAQSLYAETAESRDKRLRQAEQRKIAMEPAQTIEKGRPTKRDGRRLRALNEPW